MKYNLSDLPLVDSIEILRLSEETEIKASCGRVTGELAQEVARLWRQLPFAEQMRYHIPPFALRFFHCEREVLYSSICWECNNIWITENGVHKYAEFDADAEVSRRLLHLIEATVGPAEDN